MSESIPLFGDDERRQFRRRYRPNRAWSTCAQVATAIGLAAAVARWGWQGPLAGVLGLAFIVAAMTAAVAAGEGGFRALPRMAWTGLATALGVTAVAGMVAVFQSLGLLVVVMLFGSSPAVTTAIRVLWHSVMDTPDTAQRDGPPAQAHATRADVDLSGAPTPAVPATWWSPEEFGSLDDVSLCLAWRQSFILLESAQSPEDRFAVVEQRQRCLDELQRRYPQGVAAWLSSGARASGNPLPFLSDPPHRPAA